MQLLPDSLIWPKGEILLRCALEIEPRHLGRAHREQCKAVLVPCVDELIGGGRCRRQNAEPGEWVYPLENADRALRDARARDAVKSIATGDEVAAHLVGFASMGEANARRI